MNKNYVALHTHSDYSLLDGFGQVDEYIEVAKELGMIGIGLSDHGTASGLYKFITKANKAGIIPVPGIEFYLAPENPKGAKVKKPIYYGKNGMRAPKYDISNGAYTHLTVFAYNNKGLENLFKLTSLSWKQENFYFKPRIDVNMLAEHHEGLIVTSGCPGSEINKRFLLGQDEKAYEFAGRLKSIFGENFYIELMDHRMPNDDLERILIPNLIKLSRDLDIPVIATNDSHYARKEDAVPHESVLAMQTDSKMSEPPKHKGGKRFAFSTEEYHIKTYDEMREIFTGEIGEEALANTEKLARKCEGITLDYDPHLRPEIEIPEGYTAPTYFQKLIYDGFVKKRGKQSREMQEESVKRIQEEFRVIHSNDFITYFLVVHDYIDYAHKNGIGIGAGRGSVGGSEIAYLLDISNTDPIRHDLLFERFLSPGRGSLYQIDYVDGNSEEIAVSDKKRLYTEDGNKVVYIHELNPGDTVNFGNEPLTIKNIFVKKPGSAPDVDTDFHTEGREKVVQYCVDKYGEENVAQIVTFGTFKAKRAFKAMCTINNVPFALANKASGYIPGQQGAEASLNDILDPDSPRYNEGIDFRKATEGPMFDGVLDVASKLDGRISETGVHPCGVIIANKPLAGIVPLQVRQSDGKVITQWEYPELEALGLIKMDFLGLELIDTVEQTLENIKLTNKNVKDDKYIREIPNMQELIDGPMDDKATYENLQQGNTIGIFQLGGQGVRDLLRRAKPTKFMDIATITALYRPGPMSMNSHTEWADRVNGTKEIVSIDEAFEGTVIEDILSISAGVLVFQESLMQIASRYALMTPYESDLLRKAMGKKKFELMMSLKPKFIEGAIKNNSTKELAEKVWETMEGFAAYGFNLSHSVSYAINIYQSIYLKTHYPKEFMAALIQQGFSSPKNTKDYIQEATRMGLKLQPVSINSSEVLMASKGIEPGNDYDIIFGFSSVKKVNEEFAQNIVNERQENGLFKSVADFVKRMTKYNITSAPLVNLALAGAFDEFGVSRKLIKEKATMLIDSCKVQEDKGASLFDMLGPSNNVDVLESIELKGEDFSFSEEIKYEAEMIGMFVSSHPVSKVGHIAKQYKPVSILQALNAKGYREQNKVLGTVTKLASKTNKSGNRSIAIMIDDGHDVATSYLPRELVKRIEKYEELERENKAREKGELSKLKQSDKILEILNDDTIKPLQTIELNEPYVFTVVTRKQGDDVALAVIDVERLHLAFDGSLPFEIKVSDKNMLAKVYPVVQKHKTKNGTYVRIHTDDKFVDLDVKVKLSLDFIMDMENAIGKENVITEGI